MTYLTVVNTLVYGVEYGRGSDWGEDEGVFWGGLGVGLVNGKNLAVILTLTVALLVLDNDII